MASRLTCSSARKGALEPELEILETPDNPLDLPEDRLQEDARDTTCAPGESQLVATENKILALQTRVTQLERDLAVAHARIQDLTEINCFLRRTPSNPAPARDHEAAEPLPPPEHPLLPESRQSSMPPPAHSRLSSPALVTCLGESLPAGVGLNKSYTDAPSVRNGAGRGEDLLPRPVPGRGLGTQFTPRPAPPVNPGPRH